jgi:hypothetical protein
LFTPFHDRQEMIAGERPHLAGEAAGSVGEQDLGLAAAAGMEEDVADGRMSRVVLEAGPEFEPGTKARTRNSPQVVCKPCIDRRRTMRWTAVANFSDPVFAARCEYDDRNSTYGGSDEAGVRSLK